MDDMRCNRPMRMLTTLAAALTLIVTAEAPLAEEADQVDQKPTPEEKREAQAFEAIGAILKRDSLRRVCPGNGGRGRRPTDRQRSARR